MSISQRTPAKEYSVAILGATGLVGRTMIQVLEKRGFPISKLTLLSSPRSAGSTLRFRGQDHKVQAVSEPSFKGVDIALFSAGGGPSREWAPIAAKQGAIVIDNSSAWRMDPEVPLCVPEVNIDEARNPQKGIIANPNCSTIQLVVALKPIHDAKRIRRVIVSTYQAISGAGTDAIHAFRQQLRELASEAPVQRHGLPGQLAGGLLMAWQSNPDTGYHEEETKVVNETRKILGDSSIRVSVTAVRAPVVNGHSEAVTIETEEPLSAAEAKALFREAPGIILHDGYDGTEGSYPTPIQASGQDDVFVGRVRDDLGNPGGIQCWVVADNILKGAALNAVQIAERLFL